MPAGAQTPDLFDLLPVGAYRADGQGRFLRANQAMARLFGHPDEASLLASINAPGGICYAAAQRRVEFHALLQAQGEVRDFVSELVLGDTGERIWISENARLLRDASGRATFYDGTVQDISVHRHTEQALQLTLDNAGRGIALIDAEGILVLHNRAYRELLDLPEQLLARRPHIEEVVRFQQARGDFGKDDEQLEPDVRVLLAYGPRTAMAGALAGSAPYLRRARDGRVIEIATQMLADGGVVRTFSDVTAYVNAQEALAEKSRALEITLDSMGQGIATFDAGNRVVMYNRRCQELLDFPPELLASKPTMEELVAFQAGRGDFGENFGFVDALARGYVELGGTPPLTGPATYLRQTRQGSTLEVMTLPLPDGGAVRTFSDVSAHAQAQAALAQKEAQLSALVSALPDRVWIRDLRGVYRLSNAAHQHHLGLTEQDLIGRSTQELFGDEIGEYQRKTDDQAMAMDRPLVYEDRIPSHAEGRMHDAEVVKVAMRDARGECTGVLGISRDITTRKAAEAALIAAKEVAEAGERAKAEFLANMSHEIRTPMNAVIGLSDLLLGTELTATQREFARGIKTSGDALLGLLNNVLDVSKIESGHLELEHAPVRLLDCVESALDIAGAAAAAKGLELLAWIDDDVPATVLGDATRLRQVLINLVSNAVKFTTRGEVVLTVARQAGEDGRPLLRVAVRDTGIGIPAGRMDRLFQVFSQVDASTTRQFGGTGLGLAICRRLVTLMGGRIWVDSHEGRGSTFRFELPCEPAPGSPLPEPAPARLAGRRVLVLDGHALARDILARQLRRWGLRVQALASGVEALRRLDSGERFEAVLVAARLADTDAVSWAAQLRRLPAATQLPLLLLATRGTVAPGAAEGFARIVHKPGKTQALRDALLAALDPAPVVAAAPGDQVLQGRQVPLRLLLAEDNAINQRVAQLVLEGLGYPVEIVGNGQLALEAVAAAQACGAPFDVVLMDVQMPVLDGLEASRQLAHACPQQRERPWVIAMTANAMQGDREACLAAGMDDYLSKPIRSVEVAAALLAAAAQLAARRAGAAVARTRQSA